MPARTYRIEILGDGGKDAPPIAVIDHNAADDLEAYLSAEARVRAFDHPRMVSWRLLILTGNSVQTVRLNKEQQRVADKRRDDVFFAARRLREATEKAKTEKLKAQRLRAAQLHAKHIDGAPVPRFGPRLGGSRGRTKIKMISLDDAD